VRERYGVEPAGSDFIALRGDPSDKIPGQGRWGCRRGQSARPLRHPRGRARRRQIPGPGRGAPPLPPHRDDGLLRPLAAIARPNADLGQGVGPRPRLGS
jgi:hypothetical protein